MIQSGTAGSAALQVAEQVIGAANREHPADTVLRDTLRAKGGLSRSESRWASRAVFAYYRWLGWLDPAMPACQRIEHALELATAFHRHPEEFPDADLLSRAVPAWIAEHLEVSSGWARSLQGEPRIWLRAKRLANNPALAPQSRELAKRLGDCRMFDDNRLSEILEYLGRQDLFRTKEFQAGEFELQDINSQIVGLICHPEPGQSWWDACAGEGGKTLHLSDLMQNKGLIWSSDRAEWRLKILKRRAARAGVFNYRPASWDGGSKLPTRTKFDGVLVDAPCGGTGTWQRNPHARWTLTPQDIQELSRIQEQLVLNAVPALKPGGKLIYAVCTLTKSETMGVVEAVQNGCAELECLPMQNPLKPGSQASAQLWLWPQDFGGNGMFIAGWRRK